jgi:hypothetical protein
MKEKYIFIEIKNEEDLGKMLELIFSKQTDIINDTHLSYEKLRDTEWAQKTRDFFEIIQGERLEGGEEKEGSLYVCLRPKKNGMKIVSFLSTCEGGEVCSIEKAPELVAAWKKG